MDLNKVILFKGSDCAPCRMFEPAFDKLMTELSLEDKVDVQVDNLEEMIKYGLRQVPSVVIVAGENVHTLVGKDLKVSLLRAKIDLVQGA